MFPHILMSALQAGEKYCVYLSLFVLPGHPLLLLPGHPCYVDTHFRSNKNKPSIPIQMEIDTNPDQNPGSLLYHIYMILNLI